MLRKGLKRDILMFLAFLADEASVLTFRNQLRRLFFDGWYQKSSFAPTVSRLLSVGEIEKIEKNGQLFYQLTSRGTKKLKQNIPIFKMARKKWDGYWRIVIFDIEEKKRSIREALREKLLLLGFGMWQRSVYISPHDIEQEMNQYLNSQRLFPSCVCLVARHSGFGDNRELAAKVWQLDELNEEYYIFIGDCEQLIEEIEKGETDIQEIGELWLHYKDLIFKDPCLPRELLPEDWLAEKAREALSGFLEYCSNNLRSSVIRAKNGKRGK